MVNDDRDDAKERSRGELITHSDFHQAVAHELKVVANFESILFVIF